MTIFCEEIGDALSDDRCRDSDSGFEWKWWHYVIIGAAGILFFVMVYLVYWAIKKKRISDEKKRVAEHELEMEVRMGEEGMGADLQDQINPLAVKSMAGGGTANDSERVILSFDNDHNMQQPNSGNDFQPVRTEFAPTRGS